MKDFSAWPEGTCIPQSCCRDFEEADSLAELHEQVAVDRSLTVPNRSQNILHLTTQLFDRAYFNSLCRALRRAADQELPSRTTGRWRVAADFISRRALAPGFRRKPEICRSP